MFWWEGLCPVTAQGTLTNIGSDLIWIFNHIIYLFFSFYVIALIRRLVWSYYTFFYVNKCFTRLRSSTTCSKKWGKKLSASYRRWRRGWAGPGSIFLAVSYLHLHQTLILLTSFSTSLKNSMAFSLGLSFLKSIWLSPHIVIYIIISSWLSFMFNRRVRWMLFCWWCSSIFSSRHHWYYPSW